MLQLLVRQLATSTVLKEDLREFRKKKVKLWGYDEGYCYYVGVGHSGSVVRCKISPDQQTIVSVGDEGAIFLWTMPNVKFTDEEAQ